MDTPAREIVFDTETTGLSPEEDRIVEIGGVEMSGGSSTGRTFHIYVNPERDVPEEVVRVHGLTSELLARERPFRAIAPEFLGFVGEARLVAHNADFDRAFINAELARNGFPEIAAGRFVDTLSIARKKIPSLSSHTLDKLCKYFDVDNSMRDLHGALLDARLLTSVYIELMGGRETDFFKARDGAAAGQSLAAEFGADANRERLPPRSFPALPEEIAAHEALVESLGEDAVWRRAA